MKQAQIVTYRLEGGLAGRLQTLAHDRVVWLRDVQHVQACRSLLRQGGPAVVVLMVGKDLVHELTLLHDIGLASPETSVIVVGDTANPGLAALAWDLGARCVLQPPLPLELLPDIVLRLLPAGER